MQKQRQKIKERGSKYIPGTVNLQVLGSGAPGAPATLYLFTDQSRYLFNCGEGTQRLAHEHKTKLSRLEHIFMTRTSWSRFGGLPGLSLTVQDAGVPNLTLHGPTGLDKIFQAMRRFVVLKDLKVEADICQEGGLYEDAVMTVQYFPIRSNKSNESGSKQLSQNTEITEDNTDYFAHEVLDQADRNNRNNEFNDILTTRPEEWFEENCVIVYICKIKPRPGTLSLEKCVDKGVPPGPLLGQLKNGQDVTLPNGTRVLANDVKGPDDPGPVFILIDLPSIDYLDGLAELNNIFEKYQKTAKSDEDVASLVVHFTEADVMDTDAYKHFMDKFSPSTKHLVLNDTNSFSGYIASHRIQYQLNQLNSNVFPILCEISELNRNSDETAIKKLKLDVEATKKISTVDSTDDQIGESVKSLTCYHLRPNKGLDRSNEAAINPSEYINETLILPNFESSLATLKDQLSSIQKNNIDRANEYPKILFLGTGSCIPNKTRNVSSILIHTNDQSCILLDCGEGTSGQIQRFYGKQLTEKIWNNLKAIYISHLHADHHIGLIGVLQERKRVLGALAKPLLLFAPKQIASWLNFYNRQIECIEDEYRLISNGDLIDQSFSNDSDCSELGVENIKTCRVRHCPHSFGVAMQLGDNIKITYSGDTMPCDDLITLGQDSTILIHEATMEDELLDQACIKMHSTVSQAIDQGRRMNAKFTLLTHFSQRYAKLPRLDNHLMNDLNVGIAFDNMEVTISDLPHLHLMYSTMKLLFSEHCEEMEQKALKRAFKQQRVESRKNSLETVT